MKKFLIVIAVSLLILPAFAQFNFGLRGGYNSSLTFQNAGSVADGSYNWNNVQSEIWNNFQAGVFLRLGIKSFYIQPEVLYNVQKKDYTVTFKDIVNQDVSVNKFVNISTVDIPVLLGYKLLDLKIVNARVFLGPKFRLNANSSLELSNLQNVTSDQLIYDIKNSRIGVEFGAGIDVLMFTLDARMDVIDNIYETSWKDAPTTLIPSLSDNTFIITLGWKF